MVKESEGTPTMKQIVQSVREGAMAYLKQHYKVVTIVFIILAVFLPAWQVSLSVVVGLDPLEFRKFFLYSRA